MTVYKMGRVLRRNSFFGLSHQKQLWKIQTLNTKLNATEIIHKHDLLKLTN